MYVLYIYENHKICREDKNINNEKLNSYVSIILIKDYNTGHLLFKFMNLIKKKNMKNVL